jgi:phosphate transport system substrate-binding protein
MTPATRSTLWHGSLIGLLGILQGCATEGAPRPSVKIDGSSTVYPITNALAEQFQKAQPVKVEVNVPVGISGTGGGMRKFCAGELDIANASRPINQEEAAQCAQNEIEYLEVPVGYDGLAVVVHPSNDWARDITVAELKTIWQPEAERKIMRWSEVRAGWPDKALHLYGAGVDSGTYDYFTQAIVGKEHSSRKDFTSSEDDDVLVKQVAGDELALGFFGYAYLYKNQDRLKALPVDDGKADNGDGPIAPSPDTVQNGQYQPLARPLFIYVNKDALKRREVELFVGYYLSRASKFVARVGYVPLPDSAYPLAFDRVMARRTGSLFGGGGSQVGLSIEELLRRGQVGPVVNAAHSAK